ncbi:MAG: T9SS type A sorting domain-containing protein, partial [Balneolales bacterium]|nr:T9SS type A sorting domain-containing protein [Balneolales bacterium]
INDQTVTFVGENISNHLSGASERLFAGTIQSNLGNFYYLFEDGTFSIVDPNQEEPIVEIFSEEKADWPAIIDEGYIYRVNRTESSIEGYNFNGALVSGTPIYANDNIQFIGTPLIADITGDNIQDILVVGQDDYSVNIFAYETNGNPIEGFPLYIGGSIGKDVQPIHPVLYGDELYAISHAGDFRAWRFLDFTSSQWPSRYGENPYNKVSAYIEFTQQNNGNFSVLNKAETYNWPNPAGDETNLRYELEAPGGMVEITIIDYTGRVIFERTVQSVGGAPEEIQITTRDWGSGAYFARIKATVEGRSETKIVKIGVAH